MHVYGHIELHFAIHVSCTCISESYETTQLQFIISHYYIIIS